MVVRLSASSAGVTLEQWSDSNELDEDNPLSGGSPHFSAANEQLARDIDDDGGGVTDRQVDYTYDEVLEYDGVIRGACRRRTEFATQR
ncbi:MAG: hypothetical protein H6811_05450 [Phycisphaeraceae bacterium]|nr:hypothetical protein [Phycisphaeraceae bacterium]